MAYASPGFWQPAVMSSAPVNYPALPFPNGQQQQQQRPNLASAMQMQRQGNAWGGYNQRAEEASAGNTFGVKTGDFGGGGVFGVKTGDFGNPSPNTQDIRWNNTTVRGAGGYGGGYRSPNGGYGQGAGSLVNWYQDALNRANQANEARYRDALGGYQSRYERGMGMLSGLGQQEGRDINELYDAQGAKINQDLIGRGLGNSSVLSTMQMGNNRERNADLGRLNDRVRQQAMSTDSGLSGDVLQFMERKTDKPPDIGLLAQLYQGMGAGGYGAGGYGGGYGGGGYGGPDYGGGFNPYMYQPYMGGYYGGSSPQNQSRLNDAAQYYRQRNAAKNSQQPFKMSVDPVMGGDNWNEGAQPNYGDYGLDFINARAQRMHEQDFAGDFGYGYDPSWAGM